MPARARRSRGGLVRHDEGCLIYGTGRPPVPRITPPLAQQPPRVRRPLPRDREFVGQVEMLREGPEDLRRPEEVDEVGGKVRDASKHGKWVGGRGRVRPM